MHMKGSSVSLACMLCLLPVGMVQAQAVLPMVSQAEVVATYPHDSGAFTQGLVFSDGRLYEGTGRRGQSTLREVALESGEVLRQHALDSQYFGEGITILGDSIYQLTWQANTGFIYDLEFKLTGTFLYSGEGWGITDDGTHLIMSDGTDTLRFLDPETLSLSRRVSVTFRGSPLANINELEYIDGEIWANIWYQDALVRIDPDSGAVVGVIDLSGLWPEHPRESVLNGIAWDRANDRVFVTGKLWPSLFEIRLSAP